MANVISRIFCKTTFWRLALLAVAFLVVFFIVRSIREVFPWAPMMFNSPAHMEPAPFWHYGKETPEKLDASCVIAHAGGAIGGNTYTNSREAIENAKKVGFRFIEVDLLLLDDGTIVGSHEQAPADLQTWGKFSSHLIGGRFTPLNLQEIRDFFRSNPKKWLITDKICKKKDLEKFLQVWGEDRGNLVVEVFSPRQWVDARNLGIRLPALSIRHGWELRALRFFNVPVATCSVKFMKKHSREAEEYLKAGGSLLVYTENDADVIRQNFSCCATLFYTDYLSPEVLQK